MHRVRERKGKAITGSTCIESVSLIAPGGARRPGGGGRRRAPPLFPPRTINTQVQNVEKIVSLPEVCNNKMSIIPDTNISDKH